MSEKTIVITESEGNYDVQNNGLSEFELIGILECIIFEMKSARQQSSSDKKADAAATVATPEKITKQPEQIPQEAEKETVQLNVSTELRKRITNAVKAIKNLGGEVGDVNRSEATEEELQTELEELTNQYKRLKNLKGAGK